MERIIQEIMWVEDVRQRNRKQDKTAAIHLQKDYNEWVVNKIQNLTVRFCILMMKL